MSDRTKLQPQSSHVSGSQNKLQYHINNILIIIFKKKIYYEQ